MVTAKIPKKEEPGVEPYLARVPKWARITAGVFAVIIILGLGAYNWSVHHLVVGKDDILVSSGCAQGSTNVVIHPDGSGYSLEGDTSCLGGNPKAGTRQNYRKNTFDYRSIHQAVLAAQGIKFDTCISGQTFLQVQFKSYVNPQLMCYGTGSTNDPSSDKDTQKLNTLSDQILLAQSKADL